MTQVAPAAAPDRRVVRRRLWVAGLVCWAAAAVAYGALHLVYGPRPVYIHIRWAPAVNDGTRQQLEERFALVDGEQLDGRTWGYTLADQSPQNIRAFVGEPAVEDTHYIHRTAFRPWRFAPVRRYLVERWWIPGGLEGFSYLAVLFGVIAVGAGLLERVVPGITGTLVLARPRPDAVFVLIFVAALLPRLYLATTAPYIHDEENASIPRSRLISFAPDDLNLPIRSQNHPALPAYFVKFSSTFFGTRPLGYRMLHVITGMATIALIYLIAAQWYGVVAGRWAAALLAFNEYYVGVSSRATAHVPHLFFLALAIYAFTGFLRRQRAGYLYGSAVALGLAFYCKEHSALLLPVFALAVLQRPYRHWFRSVHVYLASALLLLVIAPDLLWNATAGEETRQATYGDHLQRIGGLGFSPYPLVFYARSVVRWLHPIVTGRPLVDATAEYFSMNPVFGVLLLGAVLAATARRRLLENSGFLVILFWVVWGFFTAIRPGGSPKDLDPVSWIWVDVTMFPAVILAGALLATAAGRVRFVALAVAAAAFLYASVVLLGT
ncbi:MAG: hypothetical protein A3F70_11715 [Acidobacteria bacterium RIFCSPLOWO2_12_FULL_67_14]|nr:MAG: hypothetical protein A3F70_11715 [Acidobacteria bacterium RIFCSPLOWO2_12_FULL_67_14]